MKAILKTPQKRTAQMKKVIIKQFPDLENLEVTPSSEEQVFKSSKYGFDEVKVKGVESEEITIVPSANEQVREGFFNKVVVEGDEDLKPENIRRGTTLFGVEGTMDAAWDSSQMRQCQYMFADNKDLIEPLEFDTSNVISMYNMHQNNTNLVRGGNYNTSNLIRMGSMHYNNPNLIEGGNYKPTNKVWDFSWMYYNCSKLKKVIQYDASSAIEIASMLYGCKDLEEFGGLLNLGKAFTSKSNNYSSYTLSVNLSNKLTHESLMNIINGLYDLNLTYDVANGGTLYTQRVRLGGTNLNKLTEEEIQIATSKGWTLTN